jgi:hypothetical protein
MAIKIPSINIRRLYTEDEFELAESIREIQYELEDIKNHKKLELLAKSGKPHRKNLHELSLKDYFSIFHYENIAFDRTKEESVFNKRLNRNKDYVKRINNFIKKYKYLIDNHEYNEWCRNNERMKELRYFLNLYSLQLNEKLSKIYKTANRKISHFYQSDYVDLFECELQEAFEIENHAFSQKIIIIKADESNIFKDIIFNGFVYGGKKYVLFSASAGQLRKTKVMFVEENAYKRAEGRLTNGLTTEVINSYGGVNITKWSAYLALATSSTKEWKNLKIDRMIVVDDFETTLKDRLVDSINSDFEKKRIRKDVSIPHTDGFGMINSRKLKDTRVIRAPWIKGLIGCFDYIGFIEEFGGSYEIQDIYGKIHDVRNIDVILTKSQFKMSSFYKDWDDYVSKFKENGCKIRYMNAESKKDLRLKAKFNYQMWNTLDVDNIPEFVEYFLEDEAELIKRAHTEVKDMLDIFHVDISSYKRNRGNLQKALYLYPSLLSTQVFRRPLYNMVTKRKNELRQGRIKINGVYTFILPDIYAWCERLFLGIENPSGLLSDGEVYCSLIKNDKEILVNRSPHLYLEHCVRKNLINHETKRWFITKGVYTSIHDMISKQLFFDVDGDIALVVDNDYLVDTAKKTMENIVPLDFELAKAKSTEISSIALYDAYSPAFDVNIGEYSNMITKVMNSDNKDIDLVAKICWLNNVFIDYAKTSWTPEIPEELERTLKQLKNSKLPNFFIYAKDKDEESVLPINKNSVVDNMVLYVDNMMKMEGKETRLRYDFASLPKFVISNILVNNVDDIIYDDGLINKFNEMCRSKYKTRIRHNLENMDKAEELNEEEYIDGVLIGEIYDYIFSNNMDIDYSIDILIKYVFKENKDKDMLFTLFGDIIVSRLEDKFSDLATESAIYCEKCGKIIKKKSVNSRAKYCDECAEEEWRIYNADKQKEYRIKKRV